MDGIYQHYIIDMSSNNNYVQVPTVQGDGNGVRGFEVELIQNGIPYRIDADDVLISIIGTKPDTTGIFNECSLTKDGYILVDITSQMSAVKGRGDYEIVLMSRSKNSQLKSFPFFIITTPSALDIDYLVSSDEFQLLTKKIVETETVIEDMRKLESTVSANEDERIESENTRNQNEQTRQSNESTRQSNETQRQDNEQERQSNENIRKNNEDQRTANEALRNDAENIRKANELIRQNNESVREQNEKTRKNNESVRESNENERIATEMDRQDNELVRQSEESNRDNAENERKANETNRQNAEAKRQETFESLEQSMNEGLDKLDVTNETARNYADLAESFAHGGTGVREGEDSDNAMEYARQAKESADRAKEISGGDFVLQSEKGKSDGVASLNGIGKIPLEQIPDFEIISDTEPIDQEFGYWIFDYE